MPRLGLPQAAAKSHKRGFKAKAKQVCRASTVTGTEAAEGLSGSAESRELLGPLVFTSLTIMGVPDLKQLDVGTKIIQMPVRPLADLAMMGDTRGNPAGAEGTAHIDIEARREAQSAECADLHLLQASTPEDQRITTGLGLHGGYRPVADGPVG
jgi:hypothetical protein